MGQLNFLIKFAVIFLAATLLFTLEPLEQLILIPFAKLNAFLASQLLSHLGIENVLNSTIISFKGHSVNVETECSASEVLLVFFSAVAAYPKPKIEKFTGIIFGFTAIFIVNMIRIVVLFLVIVFAGVSFNFFHIYIGQAVVIAATFGVWRLWVSGRLHRLDIWNNDNLDLIRRVAIFFVTLIAGLFLYGKFINSSAANAVSGVLVGHTQLFLSFCGIETEASFINIRNSFTKAQFISSCLAPPTFILYFAFLFASRFKLKTKAVLFALSAPLFYLLGIIKISSFFLTPTIESVRNSFFFNHYYPAIFLFILISGAYYFFFENDKKTGVRYYFLSVAALVASVLIWKAVGTAYREFLIMIPLMSLFGISAIKFNPYQVFSSMPAYQFILSVSLLAFFPYRKLKTNLTILALLLVFLLTWQIATIAFFNSHPIPFRAGYLRMLSIAPPIGAWLYSIWVYRRKRIPETVPVPA